MSIYKKLQEARMLLQNTKLKKSGHNKFAGYYYFELADFLPEIQNICSKLGICGTVSFTADTAYLTMHDVDDGSFTTFTSPMASAALKGCHDVQNLGAVQTYLRRYLWVNAFEIVEHDALEPLTGKEEPAKPKPAPVKKEEPKKLAGKDGEWQLTITEEGDWPVAVQEATKMLLGLATKVENVNDIFKVNRVIFDKLKEEHKETYDEIMAVFKTTKEQLTKE